jgi:hypothetical protein
MLGGQRNKSVGDLLAVRAMAIANSKDEQRPLLVKLVSSVPRTTCLVTGQKWKFMLTYYLAARYPEILNLP